MPRKKEELNKREKTILKFIEKQIMTDGYPPSVREIGQAVGLSSTATVHGYLERLEKPEGQEDELKCVARALLPPEIMEGSHLAYEMLQYTII